MAVDFYIKKDDRLPEIQAVLKDAENTVVNLSGATVRFIMSSKLDGSVKVDEPASVVDAAQGLVKYAWASADTDTAGTFNAEWEVTFADNRSETFPNNKYNIVKITADLGGVA